MPRDVSGNYTLPSGLNPVVNNTLIDVAWANTTLNDIAYQLNQVLTRDGLLGPILPLKLVDGTVGAPALCFGSQPTTGFYKTTSGFGFSLSGTNVLNVTSTEFQIVGKTGIGSATGSNVGLYVYKSGSAGGTNDSGLFVRQDGTDPIAIFSGPSGAERMRINANGDVGIGGVSPAYSLDVRAAEPYISLRKPAANSNFYGYNIMAGTDILSSWLLNSNSGEVRLTAGYTGFGGYMTLVTNGVDRMRIDASGNVGIGVAPSAWGATYTAMQTKNVGAFVDTTSGEVGIVSNAYYNGSAWKARSTGLSALYWQSAGVHQFYGAVSASAGADVTYVERMRIDASGSVSVGGSGDTQTLNVYGNSQSVAVPLNVSDTRSADGVTSAATYFRRAGTIVGSVSTTNSTTLYNTSSDYRLKNIDGDLQTSGAFIDALQPRVGTWKVDGSPFVGFVAHELQAVSPSSVTGEKDGEQMQSVAYGSAELIANMVAELKSLRFRMSVLEQI